MDLPTGHMTKLLPDGQTQVSHRNWFAIRDKYRLAGGGLRVKQVEYGEHVRVRDIVDKDVVLQIEAGAEDEGRLARGDARVDDRDAAWVVGAEYGGGAEGASSEVRGGGGEDEGFCFGLFASINYLSQTLCLLFIFAFR